MSAPRPVLEAWRSDTVSIAASATVLGTVVVGARSGLAQGAVVRSVDRGVRIGAQSMVLENSVVIGRPGLETTVGRKTVFGHRCTLVGTGVGDLCEIGNGSTLLAGSRLGDRVFLGERTLVPEGMQIPSDSVAVGNPARVVRRASDADLTRLRGLRNGDLALPNELDAVDYIGTEPAGANMGQLYAYRDKMPAVAPTATVFDSAEITGDVVVGAGSIIGAGVRIIGDSHGPVRIGERVQILENSVLHLLPDNELIVEDDVIIGPMSMIHGCQLGAGTVVEPAATVCDWARVGARSIVRAGAVLKQRAEFGDQSVIDGFPATKVDTVAGDPERPPWCFQSGDLDTLVRMR
ncbi:MAG TPA: DapH/DapD/GlmU-related protein [Acidimicrobiales bacterium]|nr:DapH/DapD/GlmU-related protein [Acidimicrobiales bacterium]